MKKLWIGVFVAALVTGAVALPAQASELHSKVGFPGMLCIRPDGGFASGNGSLITTIPCDPYDPTYFWTTQFVRDANGQHQFWIQNEGTHKCIDLTDGITADWQALQQWDCTNSTTMMWAFYPQVNPDGSYFKIVNLRSGKCMDVRAGADGVGVVIQNYHCANLAGSGQPNDAQLWQWGPH